MILLLLYWPFCAYDNAKKRGRRLIFSTANEVLHYVSQSSNNTFGKMFSNRWSSFSKEAFGRYADALQLQKGNRLRPKLVCWGFLLAFRDSFSHVKEEIAVQTALCVELIHKASIILDDLIDGDIVRNGEETFHKQYSEGEASIFSVFLINEAVRLSQEISIAHAPVEKKIYSVLRDMATGALRELQLSKDKSNIVIATKEIITKETVSLIRNSLLLGIPDNNAQDDLYVFLSQVGELAAYIFQVLNDMEPFFNPAVLLAHKGVQNFDFSNNRKNIACAYLLELITKDERLTLNELGDANHQYLFLKKLFQKYGIYPLLDNEINESWHSLKSILAEHSQLHDNYLCAFDIFITELYNTCRSRSLQKR
jgi:heptaprenyl diphosphate synthase